MDRSSDYEGALHINGKSAEKLVRAPIGRQELGLPDPGRSHAIENIERARTDALIAIRWRGHNKAIRVKRHRRAEQVSGSTIDGQNLLLKCP